MPSPRKRIGFLPSEEVHEIIEKLCKDNEFSQSKVTGLLVEEALIARRGFDLRNSNALISKEIYKKGKTINNSSINCNDLDELISDKGITYNKKKYKHKSDNLSSIENEEHGKYLFEQFKQFILFQKMIEEKQ